MAFRLDDYEPVANRLERFWADHPDGRIVTEILHRTDTDVLVRAEVHTAAGLLATGHAHEVVTARGVNSTSAVENCETSAVGRALANGNYAPKGAAARPSREEMVKVQRGRQPAARERIDRCRALLTLEADRAWARDAFVWPWDDEACAAIEARAAARDGEEPF